MIERRTFTAGFKKSLVEQALYRNTAVSQLSREHNIARVLIYRWIREYRKSGEVKSSHSRSSANKPSTEQLETLVGRLMIDNELLKKALSELQSAGSSKEIISGNTEINLGR